MSETNQKAKLIIEGQEYEFPIVIGTEGEKGIDITSLRSQTGFITLDPGYANTGSCNSSITFIDGEKGILRYRGIPVEQFADVPHPNFVEVAYLLIFGHLPSKQQLKDYSERLTENATLKEDMKHHYQGFPIGAPPMAILSAMINTLACFHSTYLQLGDEGLFEEASARLISKIRTIASYSYRSSKGLPFIYPNPKLRYAANFLHMMFSMPYDEYRVDPDIEDALNLFLILHADHEQNCSTSTVRMVGSSRANLYTSCAAGVCALWGPLHGGANVAVMEMLDNIRTGNVTPEEYLKLAKDKNSSVRLMGFGHRIYKNFDPRANILKRACDKVLDKMGRHDPLLDIARKLEEVALSDPYFVERKLYPNVDFYSGILLRAIGIPTNMFTVMFAIGRLPGWIAQWKEMHDETNNKIARPRQIYTGLNKTDYVAMKNRPE